MRSEINRRDIYGKGSNKPERMEKGRRPVNVCDYHEQRPAASQVLDKYSLTRN